MCGVNNICIQFFLIWESKLTYYKAFKLAQPVKVAAKKAADLLTLDKNIMLVVTAMEIIIYLMCAASRQQNAELVARLDILLK